MLLQREFEKRVNPKDREAQALLEEMRQHVKKVGVLASLEDWLAEFKFKKREGSSRRARLQQPRQAFR